MSERQETMHVVMRAVMVGMSMREINSDRPVKVFDDREDARAYAKRMNARAKKYAYFAVSVKRG